MPAHFFRSELGAAELRRLARRESGRACQRVVMIANLPEGMEHEEAARLASNMMVSAASRISHRNMIPQRCGGGFLLWGISDKYFPS